MTIRTRTKQGWRVTQVKYLKELLSRYGIQETASSPMQRWEEAELESAGPELIKEAQGVTGALLWSVTRSRPDLMFTTSKMSQWCTKAPSKVKEWGWQALRYAAATLELGLEFNRDVGPRFGTEEQLAFPREPRYLEIYSDASHAPKGDKSIQCILTVWRGSLLLWETARQPFTTLSSAEAELVAMVRAVQVGDCVAPIIEELIQDNLTTSLLGDNSAALAPPLAAAAEAGATGIYAYGLRLLVNGWRRMWATCLAICRWLTLEPSHLHRLNC